jgi:GMP synthase (glutamine-hydrolysing)
VAFEDLGLLDTLLAERGVASRYLEAGLDELSAAALRPADLLIVLGGPIGVYEEAAYPFLTDELAAIQSWLASNKPIVGICLGAQLIARALGMRVFPNRAKEIGIAPISLTAAGRDSPLRALAMAGDRVLHWHGDTFDLPPQAELLASTALTTNQAFRIGDGVLGLQFHIETRLTTLERWLIGHACELAAAGLDVAQLRADAQRHAAPMEAAGRHVLGEWLDRAMARM